MLLVAQVNNNRCIFPPDDYQKWDLMQQLYFLRSDLPAITHVDYTSRVQSVSKKNNQKFWHLLKSFKNQTGCSVLVNTSFNVRGEPIVCTPLDAYKCFMSTEMDILVCNNFVFIKEYQPSLSFTSIPTTSND